MNQYVAYRNMIELADKISKTAQPINELEIDLLKKQCVELYEMLLQLKPVAPPRTLDLSPEELRPLVNQQINSPEPVIHETKEEKPSLFHFSPPEPEVTEFPVNEEETVQVEEKSTIQEEPTIQPVSESVNIPPVKEPELNVREEMNLHEHLSKGGMRNDLNTKLQSKVESLKSAISLNKKIAFVNQLFKENTVEYAKAIDKLNAASTLDESMRYFSELRHTYNWSNEDELVKELQSLIEKRFAV